MISQYSKMMTNLEEPNYGSVKILGKSLHEDWPDVQRLLGLCPQHSVLYPDLTPKEHLILYGQLKEEEGGKDEIEEKIQK